MTKVYWDGSDLWPVAPVEAEGYGAHWIGEGPFKRPFGIYYEGNKVSVIASPGCVFTVPFNTNDEVLFLGEVLQALCGAVNAADASLPLAEVLAALAAGKVPA